MLYTWALLLTSAALTQAEAAPATTRAPMRTLDRQASELAWRSWLQSPEQSNQNTPPRRIIPKSLFITPLVCPKGQTMERDGCVQVVTVNKDEHTAILLEELQKLLTASPSEIQYDYGDVFEEQQGPVQVSIPIGIDPQAQPLQSQDSFAQAQEIRPDYIKIDKKEENKPISPDASKAELELLKLQSANDQANLTKLTESMGILNHNVLNNNYLPLVEKPKRDSPAVNSSEEDLITNDSKDEGQKEVVFGHVNVDPVLYHLEEASQLATTTEPEIEYTTTDTSEINTIMLPHIPNNENMTVDNIPNNQKVNETLPTSQVLKTDQNKLNPENDYADIGEAIKLISRYAAVTTDDNFPKDQKKYAYGDDILGTRTKQQYRRNKPKLELTTPELKKSSELKLPAKQPENTPLTYPKGQIYYRYSWPQTPPPDYPFRRLQDYWPNWRQTGGVYNMGHENPKRHHHSYPHNGIRSRGYVEGAGYPGLYPARLPAPLQPGKRPRSNNHELYSLLGLRHWISSESTSKR